MYFCWDLEWQINSFIPYLCFKASRIEKTQVRKSVCLSYFYYRTSIQTPFIKLTCSRIELWLCILLLFFKTGVQLSLNLLLLTIVWEWTFPPKEFLYKYEDKSLHLFNIKKGLFFNQNVLIARHTITITIISMIERPNLASARQ